MFKSILGSVILLVALLGAFYMSVNYFEALIYSEANVENNVILGNIVHYKPLILYYKGNYYIFYTVNSTESILIKDISSVNGNIILYINKYSNYMWNVTKINSYYQKTLLYVQLGNTQGYVIGKSELAPLTINEKLNVWTNRSQVYFSAYNYGNIPVYFLYIIVSGYELSHTTLENTTMPYYKHFDLRININLWEFPGNSYRNSIYVENLTNITATLYYEDVIGEGSVSNHVILT